MAKVEVSVVDGRVVVDKENLKVGVQRDVHIQWMLKTSGWTFPANGIVIHGNDGEFIDLAPTDNGRKFTGVDRNTNAKSYKYDINVSNGTTTLALDPTIENGAKE